MMAMVITMNEIATRLYQAITEKGISYGELARLTAIPTPRSASRCPP